jgi:rifampicin phosphotransferase
MTAATDTTAPAEADPATALPGSYAASLRWIPPGEGSWMQQADHFPRPVTASLEPMLEVWSSATTEYLHRLGLPIESAHLVAVNGLPYMSFRQPGRQPSKPPPAWMMRLAVHVLPSMRRAERRLRQVMAERPWVEGARRWYEHDRAPAERLMIDATSIDPWSLDDVELADHLDDRARAVLGSMRQHLLLHEHDQFPVLLFALRMTDWGRSPSEALALLAGSSPVSTGASAELDELRAAVDGRTATTLDELRSLGPEVSEALDTFLRRHGWRLVDGYDVDGPCLAELPSLVATLATAAPSSPDGHDGQHARDIADARVLVPPDERNEFDRLLADAQVGYGLRDDNSAILMAWPVGLLRRSLLAAGDRLAARGALPDAGLVIEAVPAEVGAALRNGSSLDIDALVERAEHRRRLKATEAPIALGPPEPPPPSGLSGALGTVMRMFGLLTPEPGTTRDGLHGLGVGSEPYQGTARLVNGSGQGLADFEPGEVLVATMTSPSYNVVLSLAGAVVTETGDAMSHAAIMARELRLPAVIGVARALASIRDGDLVTVDPIAGSVTVHPPAASPPATTPAHTSTITGHRKGPTPR